jgi:predicted 3-demethylubiquinone-9 3-methyltransferase (glyoxalase superfamily)
MNNSIFPCLWFDGKAKEAAAFYCSVFGNSKIAVESPMAVKFEIEGKMIMGLNGGPMFKITPSVSLFVTCTSDEEIERIWDKMTEGGSVMMPLNKYPWSEKYGWLTDRYGMTWQLMLGELPANGQKIMCNMLFTGEQYGKALEAVKRYTDIFPASHLQNVQLYQHGEPQPEGYLKFGQFAINQEVLSAMDGIGDHNFKFNEGVSLVVECKNQEEIDYYWSKLTEGGQESMCGWLKDKFGISWQIVPAILGSLMTGNEKANRVMQAVMKMKKLDIEILVNA